MEPTPIDPAAALDQASRLITQGATTHEILQLLARSAELAAGLGSATSILVLDKQGLLRNGASPSLPADYLQAIDGIKPHPQVGTCAAAAATGEIVLTPDFRADDKWAELRHLPMALGYQGAWSHPIKSSRGRVLGTFGTYYRTVRSPSPEDIVRTRGFAAAAARALER